MSSEELLCTRINWNRVILEGRKPGLTLGMGCETAQHPLAEVGHALFADLARVAEVLDGIAGNQNYQQVCAQLENCFDDPSQTYSARILQSMIEKGIDGTGIELSAKYQQELISEPLEILTPEMLQNERDASLQRQQAIEASDTESFESWLAKNA